MTSQYESISEGSSTVDDDGNRTIHTSQHGLRAPQGLGTSPLQPPAPGHASTPTQSQSGTPGNDRSAPSSRTLFHPGSLMNSKDDLLLLRVILYGPTFGY